MAIETRSILRAFYIKVLALYPRPFRERFGDSMQQTFDDLSRDNEGHMVLFTLQMSAETAVGIVRENVVHLSQRGVVTETLRNPK